MYVVRAAGGCKNEYQMYVCVYITTSKQSQRFPHSEKSKRYCYVHVVCIPFYTT